MNARSRSSLRRFVCAASLGLLAFLPACRRAVIQGPPDLRLGRDECGDCGMLVNEDRFSAALTIEQGGVREYVAFDDIGCLLDYQHEPPEGIAVVQAWVHDHPTRAWIDASRAAILFADPAKLKTPMGFGIVAFADRAAADAAAAEYGGRIVTWAEAPITRRASKQRSHTPPSGD